MKKLQSWFSLWLNTFSFRSNIFTFFSSVNNNGNYFLNQKDERVNINDIFRNSSIMDVQESDLDNQLNKNKKKWSKRTKFWVFGSISALVVVAAIGCGVGYYITKNNITLYDANGNVLTYNKANSATNWISQRTMSLLFQYDTDQVSITKNSPYKVGTGWIYQADQNTNTFYVATNLHVANILSFKGNTVKSYSNDGSVDEKYSNDLVSYVGITTNGVNTKKYLTDIVYFEVQTPEIIYTTITDSDFQTKFNSPANQYYGYVNSQGAEEKFNGAIDITILKYVINPTVLSINSDIITNTNTTNVSYFDKAKYITTFKDWLSSYWSNPTSIYQNNVEDLNNFKNRYLYMAGFPSYSVATGREGSSLADISWMTFADFTIYDWNSNGTSSLLQYPAADLLNSNGSESVPVSYPIPFFQINQTDPLSYNYASIGIQSTINATSFSGSSGSPIVINENGKYMIAGIYWGSISNPDLSFNKGMITWFNTSSYFYKQGKIEFRLTDAINNAINNAS